jgi:hypothetical protein
VTAPTIRLPERLGQPCWSAEAAERAISNIARMSLELEPYFLSTHAPNDRLRDQRGASVTEDDLYERLFTRGRRNIFAVVRGDPGTGKSHLIRWLHYRCTRDIDGGRLPSVLPVLVQRRTGSLKDALTQVVEQLPVAYRRHLRQVEDAIGNLSEDRARHALAGALQLQLVGNAQLPSTLSGLHELCLSPGFRDWLIRPGGVIDRIVRQLTEESDVNDRESLPQFTGDEFRLPSRYQANNAPSTIGLIEDLDYLPEAREEAAQHFNEACRPAVKAMSGLIGSGLRDVFDAIRRDLRQEDRRLIVFVEDVSVMASLDDDVLNAVEPNPDPQLCELTAVVGMTETGYKRLPENLTARMTDVVQVGADAASAWIEAPAELARFSARYLNISRLSVAGTEIVATDRLQGGDVAHSACTACPVHDSCHDTFGAVTFDAVNVGLFPFTETALHRLFRGLDERVAGARKNPRGLLEHILTPVLRDDVEALEDRAFPRQKLAVDLDEPGYWSTFAATYLGGWSAGEQARLRTLAQAWVNATASDDAAVALAPFLQPLGFRPFSASAPPQTTRGASSQRVTVRSRSHDETERLEPTPPAPREEPASLRDFRNAIGRWASGDVLDPDDVPRDLVLGFLRTSIAWDDEVVPIRVYDKFVKNRGHLRFEGQKSRTRAGQVVALEIERNEESRGLLEALGRWKWEGRESWAFPSGQRHRRVAARWLRSHRPRIVEALRPPADVGGESAIQVAVRVLAAVAMLRRRSDLPPDRVGVLRELLRPLPNDRPTGLNVDDERAVARLWAAHPSALDFVLSQIDAPQGGVRARGIVYIDPTPILDCAQSVHRHASAAGLDKRYTEGGAFWQGPYTALNGTEAAADLAGHFDPRRTALLQLIARDVRPALMDAGFDPDDLEVSVPAFCAELGTLLQSQAAEFPRNYPDVESRRGAYGTKGRQWAQALAAAKRAAVAEGVVGLLSAPLGTIDEAASAIAAGHTYLGSLDRDLTASETQLIADGDPDALLESIRSALEEISKSDASNAHGELPASVVSTI